MKTTQPVKSEILFPVIEELLANGQHAVITVTGNSMWPFLMDSRDSVELSAADFAGIRKGDIVLIRRDSGAYILHRVLKKQQDCFYMVGDAQEWIEGPLYERQLIARVARVWRKGREISCKHPVWRFLSFVWLGLRAFRKLIFKAYNAIRRLRK